MNVRDTIIDIKQKNPSADYDQICAIVKKRIPGCKTTPASVACTLSRLKSAIAKGESLPAGVNGGQTFEALPDTDTDEPLEEAQKRISLRYNAMERMTKKIVAGGLPSLIISGPPGMQKSWTVDRAIQASGRQRYDFSDPGGGELEEEGDVVPEIGDASNMYDKIGGNCSSVGLFMALWNMRNGGIVYLDDCDTVFRDEDTLNLLKIATDSTKERLISWRKNSAWLQEYGIDRTFDFKGHIVFLTNLDFEQIIAKGHKDSEHFKALIDRASYLCLTLRTRRDFMIRIRMQCEGKDGILKKSYGFDDKAITELLDFVDANQTRFYNLSIRLVCQIAAAMKTDPKGWRDDIEATKMRTV